jgi:hypothetical protein
MLLFVTAAAKLISSFGNAKILEQPEPILGISFRCLFWIVGIIELLVSFFCFFCKCLWVRLGLIAWLATNFLGYRITLDLIGYHRPCLCLGNLTDALHISPQMASVAMEIILLYLLIGSYGSLCCLLRKSRQAPRCPDQQVRQFENLG